MMKHATLLLVLVLFQLPAGAQEFAATCSVIGIDRNDTLTVRSGPGSRNAIVAKLTFDAVGIHVQGRPVLNGNDDWVPIRFRGGVGWVRPKYLLPTARFTETPGLVLSPYSGEKLDVRGMSYGILIDPTAGRRRFNYVAQIGSPGPSAPAATNSDNDWIGPAIVGVGAAYLLYMLFGGDDSSSSASSSYDRQAEADQRQRAEQDRQREAVIDYRRQRDQGAVARGEPKPFGY